MTLLEKNCKVSSKPNERWNFINLKELAYTIKTINEKLIKKSNPKFQSKQKN